MKHARLARLTFLFLTVTLGSFAACGEDTPPSKIDTHCNRLCACTTCTDTEKGTCLDDLGNLGDDAADKSCSDQFNTYMDCLLSEGTCTDGDYDTSACFVEEQDVHQCVNPPPPCATKENSVCDEPEGTNTCPEGSDVKDCTPPPCASIGDNICNEPQPIGDGICPAGTDTLDCYPCFTKNNGTCDEPTTCMTGTDTFDCKGCSICSDSWLQGPAGSLCPESVTPWNNVKACACGTNCLLEGTSSDVICGGATPTSSLCQSCIQAACKPQLYGCFAH